MTFIRMSSSLNQSYLTRETRATPARDHSRGELRHVHQDRPECVRHNSATPRRESLVASHAVNALDGIAVVVTHYSQRLLAILADERASHSGGLALSACMRTIMSSAGLPSTPAMLPAIPPANAILYAGIGPGPG